MLVVDIHAVQPIRLNERRDRGDGVGDPGGDARRRLKLHIIAIDCVATQAQHELHVAVLRFDGLDGIGRDVGGVPEGCKLATGGEGAIAGVVDCKGEDEVHLHVAVDGHIGEGDVIPEGADVLSEYFAVTRPGRSGRRGAGGKAELLPNLKVVAVDVRVPGLEVGEGDTVVLCDGVAGVVGLHRVGGGTGLREGGRRQEAEDVKRRGEHGRGP
ncbi:hypothetical protein GOP47_0012051 [Adiantum capillus-veneris]|uniref:Uncharacterized protein n=1 Tax=Adiantum capillus-veneris TaxID=13818 RepID=A0A9D4UTY1_ADICA|nr:hypothetical protein GOP47_0012051 [Adiantum capillus-veneris]